MIALIGCNFKRNDLPQFAPATQVTVTDYTPVKGVNPYVGQIWTITNPGKVAQLAQLADANGKGWSDDNAANMTMQTGIEMHFTGGGLNQIFTVYPTGFSNSYGGSQGNLWSRPDSVGPTTQIKLIPDDEMDKLIADIRADRERRETRSNPDANSSHAQASRKRRNDKIDFRGQTMNTKTMGELATAKTDELNKSRKLLAGYPKSMSC